MQQDLFDPEETRRDLPIEGKAGKKINPLHKLYGVMEEKKCGTCKFHFFFSFAKNYPKCGLRKITHGQATDHSSRHIACGKYEEKPEGQRSWAQFKEDLENKRKTLGQNINEFKREMKNV